MSADSMRRALRAKPVLSLGAAALMVALYAILGFYAAPAWVRSEATGFVRERYARELALGEVRVHPFKLQVEVRDLALPDADGTTTMIGFRRLFVDFELSSLWHRAYVLREVTLEAPHAHAEVRADGRLNLADLQAPPPGKGSAPSPVPSAPTSAATSPPPAAAAPPPDEPLPAVWIQSFALTSGTVDYVDRARTRPLERRFTPVNVTLQDFRTTREGGVFGLRAASAEGEQFTWQGRFALAPRLSSNGVFTVADLQLPGVLELAGEDLLPFVVPTGTVDLHGRYVASLGDALALEVSLPRIEIADTAMRGRGIERNWVDVASITLEDTALALPAHTLRIAALTVDGVRVEAVRRADGSVNLARLFAPASAGEPVPASTPTGMTAERPAASPAPAAWTAPSASTVPAATLPATTTDPATPAPPPNDAPGTDAVSWTVGIGTLALRNGAVAFADDTLQPQAKFAIAPLEATIRDLSLDLARPITVDVAATIDGSGTFRAAGTLTPATRAGDLELSLDGFELTSLQPYADATTDLEIRRGTVGVQGRLTTANAPSGATSVAFAGDVTIAQFRSIDRALEQAFIDFERVDLRKLRVALAPDALSIDRVRVVRPFARVIVSSEQVVNVAAVFDPEGTAAALAARKAVGSAETAPRTRTKSRAEARAEKRAAAAAARARARLPPSPLPELREAGMPIRIREVTVTAGRMDFADYSVQPNFAAAVRSLAGRITGLSSDPNSHAEVSLVGNVGEFSPVDIAGTVQLFAFDRHTDIGLKFQNISLPVFNPYSGKFAGYNIAKGKLTTELRYRIDARRLDARHNVRIDQLEWGEATAARGEATLPVKFATALLKDADGVITLDIPVSGTLDDPTFRLGPIIWQVVKNVLAKAVTAPFRALGALFKGAEDAQFIEFAAGQSALEAATAERLAALGRSLAPKPELQLEVPIGADPELDGDALADARFRRELDLVRARTGGKAQPSDDDAVALPPFDTLEPGRRLDVLAALYQRLSGAAPQFPQAPEPAPDLPRKERKALELQARLAWLEAECRKRLVATPGELGQLGQARGEAIERALLADTGLAPERVFLTRTGKVAPGPEGAIRLELAVK